jgi:hypothetical protein
MANTIAPMHAMILLLKTHLNFKILIASFTIHPPSMPLETSARKMFIDLLFDMNLINELRYYAAKFQH